MIAVELAAKLLLMIAVGIFAQKIKVVSERFTADLTSFIMKIVIPVMIFSSIKSGPSFSPSTLTDCLMASACGLVAMVVSLGVGQFFYIRSKKSGMGRVLRYALTFTNYSFMGIPIIDAVFGNIGTLYYVFFMIPVRIFYYALSEPLMTPEDRRKKRSSLSETLKGILLNPALVSMALGIVFWVTGWRLPSVLEYNISQISSVCSPLGLILCGLMLGKYEFKLLFNFKYIKAPLLRLIMMPVIFFALTRLMILCGLDETICNITLIFAALPAASLLPAYAKQYDPDPENQFAAAGACVISTLLSSCTVPLWYLLIQHI